MIRRGKLLVVWHLPWTHLQPTGWHTSAVYFIGPVGAGRYVAAPMADYTSSGAAYLPVGQIAG